MLFAVICAVWALGEWRGIGPADAAVARYRAAPSCVGPPAPGCRVAVPGVIERVERRANGRTYRQRVVVRFPTTVHEAAATGLSATRVHQLLTAAAPEGIPAWLSRLREPGGPVRSVDEGVAPTPEAFRREHLAEEVAALRRCLGWLEQDARGEPVVVNLRPDNDVEAEFVSFDRPRILRVLARIAADLDDLTHAHEVGAAGAPAGEDEPRARHRRRLAEPGPAPSRLCPREERARLRAEVGLPPR
ncbi:MAG: hypothetical protein M3Q65_26190 [Chloroflexota bacterium]|nr:hypothetical protein [Chloroflexota bacterium]